MFIQLRARKKSENKAKQQLKIESTKNYIGFSCAELFLGYCYHPTTNLLINIDLNICECIICLRSYHRLRL